MYKKYLAFALIGSCVINIFLIYSNNKFKSEYEEFNNMYFTQEVNRGVFIHDLAMIINKSSLTELASQDLEQKLIEEFPVGNIKTIKLPDEDTVFVVYENVIFKYRSGAYIGVGSYRDYINNISIIYTE